MSASPLLPFATVPMAFSRLNSIASALLWLLPRIRHTMCIVPSHVLPLVRNRFFDAALFFTAVLRLIPADEDVRSYVLVAGDCLRRTSSCA